MAGGVLIQPTERRWVCPNCTATDVTHEHLPHSRMHNCRGLLGMLVPMVEDGTHCKIELVEREDYTNGDDVLLAPDGVPYMSAVTTREDGNDTTVYAACATLDLRKD
jgi:hypothetical protein